ncbi:methyl-accepting chemotaxis protein [Paenibacillus cremeus]|uniref:Methyl-accepting chemotaxis protein n=1 Tax=Paenibacillus cremeus TaxID=2163881 RepID=A0A559K6C0_9BACL|nr:methyl-accepting chemotaxis protein [Paenibacillus cremeus]TVY07653.1 methyl-accepting chemotaxis protein [Paenibacillus cremeus]
MHWTVSRKLTLGFITMLLLTVITAILSLNRMMYMQSRVELVTENWMPRINQMDTLRYETEHVLNLVFQHRDKNDPEARKAIESTIGEIYDTLDQTIASYEKGIQSDAEREEFKQFTANWDEFKKNTQKTLVASKTSPAQAQVLIDGGQKIFGALLINLTHLEQMNQKGAEASSADVKKAHKDSLIWIYVILALGVLAAGLISWVFLRIVAQPLRAVTAGIIRVADGDLTTKPLAVRSRDEIGQLAEALSRMVRQLHAAISRSADASAQVTALSAQLAESAAQTAKAATQIAVSVQTVADGSREQLAAANETAHAMEEMAIGIGRISETAADMAEIFSDTTQSASKGTEAMAEAERQMTAISSTASQTSKRVEQLGEHSTHIGGIVSLIAELAHQTNLLALNASIEAARAGEHGKGFAVVATEVKKLAEQSAQSAKGISERVLTIQAETEETVTAMHEVTRQVAEGITLVNGSGQTFRTIADAISHMNVHVQEVSATSQEMAAATEQVSASVTSTASIAQTSSENTDGVAAASQQQLSSMEHISGSAEQLSRLAEELRESIRHFKL